MRVSHHNFSFKRLKVKHSENKAGFLKRYLIEKDHYLMQFLVSPSAFSRQLWLQQDVSQSPANSALQMATGTQQLHM